MQAFWYWGWNVLEGIGQYCDCWCPGSRFNIKGFPILVRYHLYIELGPWFLGLPGHQLQWYWLWRVIYAYTSFQSSYFHWKVTVDARNKTKQVAVTSGQHMPICQLLFKFNYHSWQLPVPPVMFRCTLKWQHPPTFIHMSWISIWFFRKTSSGN